MVYSISFLPYHLFKGFEDVKKIYFEKFAFYIFLEKQYGITTIKNVELCSAVLADKDPADVLNINEGHPLLKV